MRSVLFDFDRGVQNMLTELMDYLRNQIRMTQQEREDLIDGGPWKRGNVTQFRVIIAKTIRKVLWVNIPQRKFVLSYQKPEHGKFSRAGWPIIGALLSIDHSAIVHALKKYPGLEPLVIENKQLISEIECDIPPRRNT